MSLFRDTKSTANIPKKTENHNQTNTDTTNQIATADRRHSMIQTAAYLRAEKRGFQGGNPVQDWVDAEREIDTMLKGTARNTRASVH